MALGLRMLREGDGFLDECCEVVKGGDVLLLVGSSKWNDELTEVEPSTRTP